MTEENKDWAARLDAVRSELADLAAEVRRLIATAVSVDAPAEALVRATEAVAEVTAQLAPFVPSPHPPRYPGGAVGNDAADFFPFDPIVGRLNPLAPPLRIAWQDPRAVGTVTFGVPYEGPPGCVHGGTIAATFDQVFNVANLMRGVAGPTRRLEVRYLRPTPLGVELRFEGWVERVEGREVHTLGRILAGNVVTVEAEGVFVQVSMERVMQLLDASKRTNAAPLPVAETGASPTRDAEIPATESSAQRRRSFRSGGDGT
jgi:acyl-coenzyme A thioesterase PaaI-like protein